MSARKVNSTTDYSLDQTLSTEAFPIPRAPLEVTGGPVRDQGRNTLEIEHVH